MTGRRDGIAPLLAATVLLGLAAFVGGSATVATVGDGHDGTASVTAADDFGHAGTTADAGGPYAVDEGDAVALDGTGSTAGRGSIADYRWALVDGGPGSLSQADAAEPAYHAPADVANDTEVTVELTVTDNRGDSDTDRATIAVRDLGGAATPSVDALDVTRAGDRNRSLRVTADVSDPPDDGDELATVTVSAVRTKNGKVDYERTIDVAGDDASVTDTTDRLSPGEEYEVVVTVADASGNEATATVRATTG